MSDFQAFVQILQGLLTAVIAVVAVWIAFQQSKTARDQHRVAQDKLKLDLFDRRYKVYQGLMEFIGVLNNEGRAPREAFGEFYRAIGPAKFLFSDSVTTYMEGVRKKAVELCQAGAVIARATADKGESVPQQQLSESSAKERELVGWFYEQPEVAGRHFLRSWISRRRYEN
jgi:hypothetical protein